NWKISASLRARNTTTSSRPLQYTRNSPRAEIENAARIFIPPHSQRGQREAPGGVTRTRLRHGKNAAPPRKGEGEEARNGLVKTGKDYFAAAATGSETRASNDCGESVAFNEARVASMR